MLTSKITISQTRDGEIFDTLDITGDYSFTNQTGYGVDRASGTITVNTGTGEFTLANHGLFENSIIHITNLGSLTGLSLDTLYYAVDVTTSSFKLSLTLNGAAVVIGGTVGTFDFNQGYRNRTAVDQTLFQVESYKDGEIRNSAYLNSGTFIPNNTLEDDTTLNSNVVNGTTTATVIEDGVYSVSMIPFWLTSQTLTVTGTNEFTITGVDLSGLYEGYTNIYINDSGTEYLYSIDTLEFTGGNTVFTVVEDIVPLGPILAANWSIGTTANFVYLAYYNVNKCWQEQVAGLTTSDFDCLCRGGNPSKKFNNADVLSQVIQGAIASRNCGEYGNAQEIITYGVKFCIRLDNCSSCG